MKTYLRLFYYRLLCKSVSRKSRFYNNINYSDNVKKYMKNSTLAVFLLLILALYVASCIAVAVFIRNLHLKESKLTTKNNKLSVKVESVTKIEIQNKPVKASTSSHYEKTKTAYTPSLS